MNVLFVIDTSNIYNNFSYFTYLLKRLIWLEFICNN